MKDKIMLAYEARSISDWKMSVSVEKEYNSILPVLCGLVYKKAHKGEYYASTSQIIRLELKNETVTKKLADTFLSLGYNTSYRNNYCDRGYRIDIRWDLKKIEKEPVPKKKGFFSKLLGRKDD